MAIAFPKSLEPVVNFSIQVVVGAVAFTVVFLVAIGISALVTFFERLGIVPPWLAMSARWVEIGIWVIDLGGFSLFILAELLKSARALLGDWNGHG